MPSNGQATESGSQGTQPQARKVGWQEGRGTLWVIAGPKTSISTAASSKREAMAGISVLSLQHVYTVV